MKDLMSSGLLKHLKEIEESFVRIEKVIRRSYESTKILYNILGVISKQGLLIELIFGQIGKQLSRIAALIRRIFERLEKSITKVGSSIDDTFGRIRKHALRTEISVMRMTIQNKVLKKSVEQVGQEYHKLEGAVVSSKIPAAIRSTRIQFNSLRNTLSQPIQISANVVTNTVSTGASGGGGSGLVEKAGEGFKYLLDKGASKAKSFKSIELIAGGEAGGKLNNDLAAYAKNTVYNNDVFKNAETMLHSGIAAENVMPNIAMLGDVAHGDVEKLNSLTDTFANIRIEGKLTEGSLREFKRMGFDPLEEMSRTTGVSLDVLKESMENGRVSFTDVQQALQSATSAGGEFYNSTNKIGQTDFGIIEIFNGKLEALSAQLGEVLLPTVGDFIDNYLSVFIDKLSEAVVWIQENWNWLSVLVTVIGTLILAYQGITFATTAWKNAKEALNLTMKANPIFIVIAALAALAAGIMVAWNQFEGFRMVVYGLWGAFKQIFTNIADFFAKTFDPIFEAIQAFKEGRILDAGKAVLKLGANIATMPARLVGEALSGGLTEGVKDAYESESLKGIRTKSATEGADSTPTTVNDTNQLLEDLKKKTTSERENTSSVANGVTSAGPRVININGVKFTDKIELHVSNLTEGLGEIEAKFDEYLLRILNSGSALQS